MVKKAIGHVSYLVLRASELLEVTSGSVSVVLALFGAKTDSNIEKLQNWCWVPVLEPSTGTPLQVQKCLLSSLGFGPGVPVLNLGVPILKVGHQNFIGSTNNQRSG